MCIVTTRVEDDKEKNTTHLLLGSQLDTDTGTAQGQRKTHPQWVHKNEV